MVDPYLPKLHLHVIPYVMNIDAEQQAFEQEVSQVTQWWASDRFKHITRPYRAEDGELYV